MADSCASNAGIRSAPVQAPVPALPPAPEKPSVNIGLPAAWPPAAQRVTVVALLAALSLLSWQTIQGGRWSARPTTLTERGLAFRVDLNTADHAGLMQLPGVGESLAQRIEDHRSHYGPFHEVDELRNVSGIGPATLERLRPFVYAQLDSETNDEESTPAPVRQAAKRSGEKSGKAKGIASKKAEALAGPVDLNRATPEELQRLPGVGPAMSARIVAARAKQPFAAVEDLRRVHGIGAKTLERLRPHVTVGKQEQ
jgi:competence protein ComEA